MTVVRDILYCEGRPKPKYRGVSHILLFPFTVLGFVVLASLTNDNIGILSAFLVSFTCAICLGVSSMYHIITWNKNQERFMKRLDHSCILLVAYGSYFPLCFYTLDKYYGSLFLISNTLLLIFGFIWIFSDKPSLFPILLSTFAAFPFFYLIALNKGYVYALTAIGIICIYGIGLVVFKMEYPNPYPKVFGYHEIFHLFVICSMFLTHIIHYKTLTFETWLN